MVGIRVNGVPLDLDSDTKVFLTTKLFTIADFSSGGGFSNTIEIPDSQHNRETLNYINDVYNKNKRFINSNVPAILFAKDGEMPVTLNVRGVKTGKLQLYLTFGNTSWIDKVKEDKVKDLPFTSLQNWNYSPDGSSPHFLAFLVFNDYYGQYDNLYSFDDLCYAVSIRAIFRCISFRYSIKFDGTFFQTPDYARVFMPAVKKAWLETRENILLARQTLTISDEAAYSNAHQGSMFVLNFSDQTNFGMTDPENVLITLPAPPNPFRETYFIVPQDGRYLIKIAVCFELKPIGPLFDTPAHNHRIGLSIGIKERVQTTFSSINPFYYRTFAATNNIAEIASPVNDGFKIGDSPGLRLLGNFNKHDGFGGYGQSSVYWYEYEYDVWLKKGEQYNAFVYIDEASTRSVVSFFAYTTNWTFPSMPRSLQSHYPALVPRLEITEKYVAQGKEYSQIVWSEILPDITIREFLSEIMKRYCIITSYDETTGTVYMNTFEGLKNTNNAKDFSSKVINIDAKENNFELDTFARINYIESSNSRLDLPDRDSFIINRSQLTNTQTYLSSYFSGYNQELNSALMYMPTKINNPQGNRVNFQNIPYDNPNYLVKWIGYTHDTTDYLPSLIYLHGRVQTTYRFWSRTTKSFIHTPPFVPYILPIVWYTKTTYQYNSIADADVVGLSFNTVGFLVQTYGIKDRYWRTFEMALNDYVVVIVNMKLLFSDFVGLMTNNLIYFDTANNLYLVAEIKEYSLDTGVATLECIKLV